MLSVILSLFSSTLYIITTYPIPEIDWFYELDIVIMSIYIGKKFYFI